MKHKNLTRKGYLLRLSVFEEALLEYVQHVADTRQKASELLREGLAMLVHNHPNFSEESFEQFIEENYAPTLDNEDDLDELQGCVRAFLENDSAMQPLPAEAEFDFMRDILDHTLNPDF